MLKKVCERCEGNLEMELIRGNVCLEKEGVEITIIGASFWFCENCKSLILTPEVEKKVTNALRQKKKYYPTPPYFTLNLLG